MKHSHSKFFYLIHIIGLIILIPCSLFLVVACIYSFIYDFQWLFLQIFILILIGNILVFLDLFRKIYSDQMVIYEDYLEILKNSPFPFNRNKRIIIPINRIKPDLAT